MAIPDSYRNPPDGCWNCRHVLWATKWLAACNEDGSFPLLALEIAPESKYAEQDWRMEHGVFALGTCDEWKKRMEREEAAQR